MSLLIQTIAFNHDPNSESTDAVNIRLNRDNYLASPEWIREISQKFGDSRAAYSIASTSGQTLTIEVTIARTDQNLSTATIRAIESSGLFANVEATPVAFPEDEISVMLNLENVLIGNTGVGFWDITWVWEFLNANGVWEKFDKTNHRIYALLDLPFYPWVHQSQDDDESQLVWTEVLDHSCAWAAGAKSMHEAAYLITHNVFHSLGQFLCYDCPDGSSLLVSSNTFLCTEVLQIIADATEYMPVNCVDCATLLVTFANAVGCQLECSRIGMNFPLNRIRLIGRGIWMNGCSNIQGYFTYHEFALSWNADTADSVYDACLEVDMDADPANPPVVPLLPAGIPFSKYKSMLIAAGTISRVVDGISTFRKVT